MMVAPHAVLGHIYREASKLCGNVTAHRHGFRNGGRQPLSFVMGLHRSSYPTVSFIIQSVVSAPSQIEANTGTCRCVEGFLEDKPGAHGGHRSNLSAVRNEVSAKMRLKMPAV